MIADLSPSFEEGEIEDDCDPINIPTNNCPVGETKQNAVTAKKCKWPDQIQLENDGEYQQKYDEISSNKIDPFAQADLDDYELLYVRGASPPKISSYSPTYYNRQRFEDLESRGIYDGWLDDSNDSQPRRKKKSKRNRNKHGDVKKSATKRKLAETNDDESPPSPKSLKMEICKFYLSDCCSKRIECTYMHSEFPCKFFHLGFDCKDGSNCKFSHGKALSRKIAKGLARHIASAPKHILGNFRRLGFDEAMSLIEKKNCELNGNLDNNASTTDSILSNTGQLSPAKFCPPKIQSVAQRSTTSRLELSNAEICSILTSAQNEKLTTLGITQFSELQNMTLMQLTGDIGLSLQQIGEIQEITKSHKNDDSPKITATTLVSNNVNNNNNNCSDEKNWDCEVKTTSSYQVERKDDETENWDCKIRQPIGVDADDWDVDEVNQTNVSVDKVQLDTSTICANNKITATTLVSNNNNNNCSDEENWNCEVKSTSYQVQRKDDETENWDCKIRQPIGVDPNDWDVDEAHQTNISVYKVQVDTSTIWANNDRGNYENWACEDRTSRSQWNNGNERTTSNCERAYDANYGEGEENWDDEPPQSKNHEVEVMQPPITESKADDQLCSDFVEKSTIDQVDDEATEFSNASEGSASGTEETTEVETQQDTDWLFDGEGCLLIDERSLDISDSDDEGNNATKIDQSIDFCLLAKPSLDVLKKRMYFLNDNDDEPVINADLFDQIAQDGIDLNSVSQHPSSMVLDSESKHSADSSSSNSLQIAMPTLSAHDLRLPYDDILVNHPVAVEIDGSYKPYRKIPWKLIQIASPERRRPSLRLENTSNNDPRFCKSVHKHDNKKSSSSSGHSTATITSPDHVGMQKQNDPRNQTTPTSNQSISMPIKTNFNFICNNFLQKSFWYLNQSSKAKIEINELVHKLLCELNRFELNAVHNRPFQLTALPHSVEIQKILQEIGLEVGRDGTLSPAVFQTNQLAGVSANAERFSSINWTSSNVGPLNMFQQQYAQAQNFNMVPNFCMNQRFDYAKPGLLGFAPGFEHSGLNTGNTGGCFGTPGGGCIENQANYEVNQQQNEEFMDNGNRNMSNCNNQRATRWNKRGQGKWRRGRLN